MRRKIKSRVGWAYVYRGKLMEFFSYKRSEMEHCLSKDEQFVRVRLVPIGPLHTRKRDS